MISAVILAAGQSRRMGHPKMLLPWGTLTIIEQVIATFLKAGIEDVIVVTGGAHEQVEKATAHYPVRRIYNRDFANSEMLASFQLGLRAVSSQCQAALVGLGDQPQIYEKSIRRVCEAYLENKPRLVVPSFQMRRGHPWLVARPLWAELLQMGSPESLRHFLHRHTDEIYYVDVDTPDILADLDTPADYEQACP